MDSEGRYKAWTSYAEITRKWAIAMDAKAGFMTALNLGLLAVLWTGIKIHQSSECLIRIIGSGATICITFSIFFAILTTIPRESLSSIFGKDVRWNYDYNPISYYGYVAQSFNSNDYDKFSFHAATLDYDDLADEALEQHFALSHVVTRKSGFVKIAAILLMFAVVFTALTFIANLML